MEEGQDSAALCSTCAPKQSGRTVHGHRVMRALLWQVRLGEKEALDSTLRWFEARADRIASLEFYQVQRPADHANHRLGEWHMPVSGVFEMSGDASLLVYVRWKLQSVSSAATQTKPRVATHGWVCTRCVRRDAGLLHTRGRRAGAEQLSILCLSEAVRDSSCSLRCVVHI